MIINHVRWRVHLVPPAHPMLLTPWGSHSLGVCDRTTRTICVDGSLSREKLKEVLCHEIVHAYMYSYNVNLSYMEEEMVADLITNYGEAIIEKTQMIYNSLKIK